MNIKVTVNDDEVDMDCLEEEIRDYVGNISPEFGELKWEFNWDEKSKPLTLEDCFDVELDRYRKMLLLTVKPDQKMNLIKMKWFTGNETMLRLTWDNLEYYPNYAGTGPRYYADNNYFTMWNENGGCTEWYCGRKGYTLVGESLDQIGAMLMQLLDKLCKEE